MKCQSCQKEFEIRPEDREFLKKISLGFGEIPPPKLCMKCREQRRLTFRNESNLYKRKDGVISFFDDDSPFTVYSHEKWWSDKWDPLDHGADFDFSRGFFEQFYGLQLKVPRPPLVNNKAENSPYCNFADGNKDCHLVTSANRNQDCYYGFCIVENKDVVDCLWCTNSELIYQCGDCLHCYNLRFAENCENSSDSAFLSDCKGVRNCLFCCNLRGKQFQVFNKPVSKEEFQKVFDYYFSGSYRQLNEGIAAFGEMKKKFPVRRANNFISCENVIGNNIFNSKNIYFGFDVYNSQDCTYCHDGLGGKDCNDICFFDGTELCYESTSLIGYGYRFTNFCRNSADLFYCDNCHGCKNSFGCVGLRNKSYCVLNKQYSKAEYENLVSKIVKKMNEIGEWGEFFPIKYSLFAYNETLANDYFPVKKEDAELNGWRWKKEVRKDYLPQKFVIPDNVDEVGPEICDEILACETTGKNFRIVPQEWNFYKKMRLPIPRKSPDARGKERILGRNPRSLWDRVCDNCGAEIQTAYGPARPELIYCEECYLAI